jgi:hypothetical protein
MIYGHQVLESPRANSMGGPVKTWMAHGLDMMPNAAYHAMNR